jgi:hypothetical protein
MSDALIREALRIYRRYAVEIVEAYNLCPWAERARHDGRVRESVLVQDTLAVEPALAEIAGWTPDESAEIGLLIFPRLRIDRLQFDQFVAKLRLADEVRHPLGGVPFAMAAFHPAAPVDLATAERLIPFIRRSPDPTIQLVRRSVLERVRERSPQGTQFMDVRRLTPEMLATVPAKPLRQKIAEANLGTVQRVGLARIEQQLRDILDDRQESYRRVGEPEAVADR